MGNAANIVQCRYTESLYILAKLSCNVYDLDNGYNEDVLNEGVGSYRIIKDSVRTNALMCYMAVWQNDNGVKVLVVKGTGNGGDVLNDIALLFGGSGSFHSISPILDQARHLISQYGVHLVTGHSLGGYVAEIIATNHGICDASFCGPGVNGKGMQLGGSPHDGFQNIQFEHDPIGNINCAMYTHVQWSVYVAGPSGILGDHSIVSMVNYFQSKTHLTNSNVVKHSQSGATGYYYPQ